MGLWGHQFLRRLLRSIASFRPLMALRRTLMVIVNRSVDSAPLTRLAHRMVGVRLLRRYILSLMLILFVKRQILVPVTLALVNLLGTCPHVLPNLILLREMSVVHDLVLLDRLLAHRRLLGHHGRHLLVSLHISLRILYNHAVVLLRRLMVVVILAGHCKILCQNVRLTNVSLGT